LVIKAYSKDTRNIQVVTTEQGTFCIQDNQSDEYKNVVFLYKNEAVTVFDQQIEQLMEVTNDVAL